MTYSSGGLIQPADFNAFTGGGAGSGANVSGQINTVLGTGYGNAGYGQTLVSNVSAGIVSATNWASLVNAVNTVRKHQQNTSFTNLSVPTAGTIVSYLSTLSTQIANAYTDRLTIGTSRTVNPAANSQTLSLVAGTNTTVIGTISWTITFGTPDQCRYFFNTGGRIGIEYTSFVNNLANARGTSIQTLAQTNFGSKYILANSWTARSGAGGNATSDTTTNGYYGATWNGGYDVPLQIFSTSYYSSDSVNIQSSTRLSKGSYGDNGSQVTLSFQAISGSTNTYDSSINISLTMTLRVEQASLTFLQSQSWGTPTIAASVT